MKKPLVTYAGTLLALLVLDGLWLGVLMAPTYRTLLGSLMLPSPLLGPAAAFYLMYAAALVWFAVWPALRGTSALRAAGNAALLGLAAYGTYDLTNWATLTGWPPLLVFIDMAWGMLASAIAASVGFAVGRKLG
ncbi:MAG: DUF2177 family protein [Pseudomonas sp.]|uniref:DUF2177 family protein n=1 Tax=Pseudomonas abieticivorans TaxID=2931382 RepID=UPI0020C0FE3C|nr:DUF2177 family protein [Pseudomonas sp. PIA16]MDE1168919.1 DUF2177 family protein [Pseudomonas sp.]